MKQETNNMIHPESRCRLWFCYTKSVGTKKVQCKAQSLGFWKLVTRVHSLIQFLYFRVQVTQQNKARDWALPLWKSLHG